MTNRPFAAGDARLPALARELFAVQGEEYALLTKRLQAIEAKLMVWIAPDARRAATTMQSRPLRCRMPARSRCGGRRALPAPRG
jgi:hypothetical protein